MSTKRNRGYSKKDLMLLAFKLAASNLGNTSTNPPVGCAIENQDNIISYGITGKNGTPHAEYNAIKKLSKKFKNSTMYISLEPCSHYGKTPPCTNLIKKKIINKVVYSIIDPDPRVSHKSKKILRNKNIQVQTNFLKYKGKKFYEFYFKNKIKKMPYVTSKLAITKDGFIKNKKSKNITNNVSRLRGHIIRAKNNAIITTAKTIIDDNPLLNCRISGLETLSPTRIVLDKWLKTPIKSKLVKSSSKHKTIIFFNYFDKKKISLLKKNKIKLIHIPLNEREEFDLNFVLKKIYLLGFSRLMVEAGLKFNTELLKLNLIDQFYIFNSMNRIGTDGLKKSISLLNILNKKKIKKNSINVNLNGEKLMLYELNRCLMVL